MRHTLETIQNAQTRRGFNQTVVRAGGQAIAKTVQGAQEEKLQVGGTAVFLLGQHSLDDTTARWIP